MQHVNTDSDAVDAFKVLDDSGGGAISRLVVVGQFWIVCKHMLFGHQYNRAQKLH